jgi:Bacterial dnaA protein helix-turn-helix
MYTATRQPVIERRRAHWCPGGQPLPAASTQSVGLIVSQPAQEPDLPNEHRRLRLNLEQLVACRLDVEPDLLNFPSRGRAPVCEARQISMYLARVCFCLSLTEVGQMFRRDRTTVAHACIVVEHRRDDVGFDLFLTKLELIARIMSGLPGPLHGVTTPAPRNARLNSPCRGVA